MKADNPPQAEPLSGRLFDSLLPWGLVGAGAWLAYQAFRISRQQDLKNKNVLITGGSRGLGLVLARQLADEGAHLILVARDRAELDRAFDELAARNVRVLTVACDVTEPAQVREAVDAVLKRWGHIDVLINNAGTVCVGPQEVMTEADFEHAMRTNFWGPLYMIRAVVPSMKEHGHGRIVNVSSIGGKVSIPHLLPYSASKFALVGLSEGLRAELGKDGILVTTVCPGLMTTGSPRNAMFKGQHAAEYAWFSISDALPGVAMRPEDAARAIIDACKYGDAEIVLSLPARVAVAFHDLFPGVTTDILALINRLLPGPGGTDGQNALPGKESESGLVPDWLQDLNDRAAAANNELSDEEREKWKPRNRIFKGGGGQG
jgi:NAD(P)-dependent dehydrogenase (short-subunit alcohol dehydrogenase family)